MVRGQRQGKAKHRSRAGRALDADLAPVRLHQALADGEANPGCRRAGARGGTVELLEESLLALRGDPGTGVMDGDYYRPRRTHGGYRNWRAVRRVLDRVL